MLSQPHETNNGLKSALTQLNVTQLITRQSQVLNQVDAQHSCIILQQTQYSNL